MRLDCGRFLAVCLSALVLVGCKTPSVVVVMPEPEIRKAAPVKLPPTKEEEPPRRKSEVIQLVAQEEPIPVSDPQTAAKPLELTGAPALVAPSTSVPKAAPKASEEPASYMDRQMALALLTVCELILVLRIAVRRSKATAEQLLKV